MKKKKFLTCYTRYNFGKNSCRVFHLKLFHLQNFFSTQFFDFFNFGHLKITFSVVFEKAIWYFASSPVMKVFFIWNLIDFFSMFQMRDVYPLREFIGFSTSSIGDCLLISNHIIGIISLLVVCHLRIFLIGIHSMQDWKATTKHGVTWKRSITPIHTSVLLNRGGRYSRFTFVKNTIGNSPKVPRAKFPGTDGLLFY